MNWLTITQQRAPGAAAFHLVLTAGCEARAEIVRLGARAADLADGSTRDFTFIGDAGAARRMAEPLDVARAKLAWNIIKSACPQ